MFIEPGGGFGSHELFTGYIGGRGSEFETQHIRAFSLGNINFGVKVKGVSGGTV